MPTVQRSMNNLLAGTGFWLAGMKAAGPSHRTRLKSVREGGRGGGAETVWLEDGMGRPHEHVW